MSETETINIDKQKLFNLVANLLVAFIQQPQDNAKKAFKQLKAGTVVKSGELTAEKTGTKIAVKLELDRREFRGRSTTPVLSTPFAHWCRDSRQKHARTAS